ncbi:hypothetical protein BTA51_15405 [Hahella sp. CCB-MM4]|uniref:hypothetical protein n=1 Tax=Hahella sp. (strain CCB-MM4) TaxID=1926491 RepID=UPI000B9BF71F|nr:hypothetical protein [Hahella sp. CCB-MM4]OZG72506.1 hypothetical protein BTA51_15405 [Hahella sp. CCB-MM4]
MSASIAGNDNSIIPLLDDRVLEQKKVRDKAAPSQSTGSATSLEGTDTMKSVNNPDQTQSKNPFLPYENLAKLALERAEFQKQFKSFFESQQNQRPASSAMKDTQDLDRIVHLATQKVLAEYMPQIEQRIRAEVIRQLGSRLPALGNSGIKS